MTLMTKLTDFPGIGAQRGKALEKLGLVTVGDLLAYCPRDYEDRTKKVKIEDILADEAVCVEAMVARPAKHAFLRKGLDMTRLEVVDETGQMTVTFFNQSYVKDALAVGATYLFYGKADMNGTQPALTNPSFESLKKPRFLGRIMPVYALTRGVSNNLLAGLALQGLDCAAELTDRLPRALREAHGLCALEQATRQIHFPEDMEAQAVAARRLLFEELFFLAIGLAFLKGRRDKAQAQRISVCNAAAFEAVLPFAPTGAQQRVVREIIGDLQSGAPMNRLVQGDVGSGKTAVAAAAAFFTVRSGFQAALMAPTEILAEQHYRSLAKLLEPAGIVTALLTGSTKAAAKRKIYAGLADGSIHFVIGTHALISEPVQFEKLALVITDEQHRFGVNQRAALLAKGEDGVRQPHALVMSATPIPRTLALIVYGDLDISVIDELPPGRTPVKTYLMTSRKRLELYQFIDRAIAGGRQAYLVCPMVEENEATAATAELKAVTSYADQVRAALPHRQTAVIHGKLKAQEKEAIMQAFAAGETHILVSTTVIEVGVDVPNATMMAVENAERFGLSQLHQLRGRVGRGGEQSHCFLISDSANEDTRQRLKILRDTTDGFKISEEDLKLRGPGEFFGSRQHGLPAAGAALLAGDLRLMKEAQEAAHSLLRQDAVLSQPEHGEILAHVKQLFGESAGIFN
jgi:ATP-dependent DNA helicase RecG